MRGHCNKKNCPAPKGICIEKFNNEHLTCDSFTQNIAVDSTPTASDDASIFPWNGEFLQPSDIDLVCQRSYPQIIAMIGSADAGKTSYLGMLYTLLFNGRKLEKWSLCGSYTLAAWEALAQTLKIKPNGKVDFPAPTSSSRDFYSLYHLALKQNRLAKDILIADSSGEVFNLWAEDVNDENAENARWIYKHANAFTLFIDTKALIEKRGSAKAEVIQIAEQLATNLNGRPIVAIWSKADLIDDVRTNIKEALQEELQNLFHNVDFYQISNFPGKDDDPLCHTNNIQVLESLLNQLNKKEDIVISLSNENVDHSDYFFKYGEHDEC